ncbi:MAG: hypothetical protein QOG28_6984 [Trebonia sp.]|jgi:hypothetical protein|nr:hypothetical protein [Trebonia sp.]
MMRNRLTTWVGVAGFEPAASSSRSQLVTWAAGDEASLAWESPSVWVRWCPSLMAAIATHLVTRALSCLAGEWLLRRSFRTTSYLPWPSSANMAVLPECPLLALISPTLWHGRGTG